MLFMFVIACSNSLIGEWNGSCHFTDDQDHKQIDIDVSVERDNGYVIEGKLNFIHWNADEEYDGTMQGDYTGKHVLMKTEFENLENPYRLRIETERVGALLEGSCNIRSLEGINAAGLSGEITLSR